MKCSLLYKAALINLFYLSKKNVPIVLKQVKNLNTVFDLRVPIHWFANLKPAYRHYHFQHKRALMMQSCVETFFFFFFLVLCFRRIEGGSYTKLNLDVQFDVSEISINEMQNIGLWRKTAHKPSYTLAEPRSICDLTGKRASMQFTF